MASFGRGARAVVVGYKADKGDGMAHYKHDFDSGKPMIPLRRGDRVPRSGVLLANARTSVGPEGTLWYDNPAKRDGRGRFRHARKSSPSRFHPGSFRTVTAGGHRVVLGCPRDHAHRWISRGGRRVCEVRAGGRWTSRGAQRAQSVLHPKREKRNALSNPRGGESGMAKKRGKRSRRSMPPRSKSTGRFLKGGGGSRKRRSSRSNPRRVARRSRRRSRRNAWSGQSRRHAAAARKGWRGRRRSNPRRRRYRRNPGFGRGFFGPGFQTQALQFGGGVLLGGVATGLLELGFSKVEFLAKQPGWIQGLLHIGGGVAAAGAGYMVPALRRRPATLLGMAAPGVSFGLWNLVIAPLLAQITGGTTEEFQPGAGTLGYAQPGDVTVGTDGQTYMAVAENGGMGFVSRLSSLGMGQGEVAPGTTTVGADGRTYMAVAEGSSMGFVRQLSGVGREPIIIEGAASSPSDVMSGVGREPFVIQE